MIQPLNAGNWTATKKVAVTKSVTLGTAGAIQIIALDSAPIMNSDGNAVGTINDTVKAITGLSAYTEVFPATDHQFAGQKGVNTGPITVGQYAVDYVNGIIWIIPLAGGSVSLVYNIRAIVTATA